MSLSGADVVGRADYELGARLDKLRQDIGAAEDEFRRSGKTVEGAYAQAGARAGEDLSRNVKRGATIAGAAVGVFVAGAATDFVQFDDQMRQVFSILPGISGAAMDKMKKQVLDLSQRMGILPEETIPALYDALSSGIPPENAFTFMEAAAKAARAGVADTQATVRVLAGTLNAYQIDASRTTEVTDKLFTAVKLGVTTLPELADSLAQVSPMAAAMGISIDDVLAAITAMTLQGTPTSEAITQMRSSMVAFQRVTPDMRKALGALGFETGQAAIKALGYQGALDALRAEADRTGTPLIKLTGRVEGANAMLQLTGDNAARSADILGQFGDTAGSTEAAFREMQGGVGGAARQIAASVKIMSIQVGEHIGGLTPIFAAFGPTMARLMGAGLGAVGGRVIAPAITAVFTSAPVQAAAGAAGAATGTVIGTALGLTERFTNATVTALLALPGSARVVSAASSAGALIGTTMAIGVGGGILLALNEKYAEIFGSPSSTSQLLTLLAGESGEQAGEEGGKRAGEAFAGALLSEAERRRPEFGFVGQEVVAAVGQGLSDGASALEGTWGDLGVAAAKRAAEAEAALLGPALTDALSQTPLDLDDWRKRLRELGKLPSGEELFADILAQAAEIGPAMAQIFAANNPRAEHQLVLDIQGMVDQMALLEAAGFDVPTAMVENLKKVLRQSRGAADPETQKIINSAIAILETLEPTATETGRQATTNLSQGILGGKEKLGAAAAAASEASKIPDWGAYYGGLSIALEHARGIRAGKYAISRAAADAAAAAANFLGNSLPTEGPLSKVGEAGPDIAREWRRGLLGAQGIFADAASAVAPSLAGASLSALGALGGVNGAISGTVIHEHRISTEGAQALRDAGFDEGKVARALVDFSGLRRGLAAASYMPIGGE